MEAGVIGRHSTTVLDGDEDGAVEDVFIYLPDNGRDKDLQKVAPKDMQDDFDLDDDGIPELEVEAVEHDVPEE